MKCTATSIAAFAVVGLSAALADPIPEQNIARQGTALMGLAAQDNGARGVFHINAQGYMAPHYSEVPEELIDGNRTTDSVVDTYSGDGYVDDPAFENPDGGANPYDFLGVEWETPQDGVRLIHLYHRIFSDGGWFGGLTDAVTPKVQVNRDGGTIWVDVEGVTSDYTALVSPTTQNGQIVGPISFIFPAQNGIDGIRLFGEGGGKAGVDTSGFVAAAEFEVYTIARPVLVAHRVGASLELTWSGAYQLQSAPRLGGAWSVLNEVESPYTVPMEAEMEFFRLVW